MKKRLLALSFILISFFASAQVATDFTANDCSGTSHNLFNELDGGKVIVLCWVMPCGACTGPTLTTFNVVQSYTSSHPGIVNMYLVDDYANTSCSSLDSWKNSIGVSATSFSNSSISMTDYGSTGMPKIVVIGGGNHTVFYNANNTVNATALQAAIDDALSVAGIGEQNKFATSLTVSPNPATDKALIKFSLAESDEVQIQLYNLQGKLVKEIFSGRLNGGENELKLNTGNLAAGTYLLKAGNGRRNSFTNLVVVR